jgi:hypothetical protein
VSFPNISALPHCQRIYCLDPLYLLHSGDQQHYTAAICPQCFLSFVRISFLEICTNRVYYKSRDKWTVVRAQNWEPHSGPKGDRYLTQTVSHLWAARCKAPVRVPARALAIITERPVSFLWSSRWKARLRSVAQAPVSKNIDRFWHSFKHIALYEVISHLFV